MIVIRELNKEEVGLALELSREVFMEFEAPVFSQKGIDEFTGFLNDQGEVNKLRFYGALDQDVLLGVIAMREEHISLLFVKKEFHRRGIAKALFLFMLKQINVNQITVNSSPYAKEIYEKLGFTAVDSEQLKNGIRYIPMVYEGN